MDQGENLFMIMEPQALIRLCEKNGDVAALCGSESFWKQKVVHDYELDTSPSGFSWKQTYFALTQGQMKRITIKQGEFTGGLWVFAEETIFEVIQYIIGMLDLEEGEAYFYFEQGTQHAMFPAHINESISFQEYRWRDVAQNKDYDLWATQAVLVSPQIIFLMVFPAHNKMIWFSNLETISDLITVGDRLVPGFQSLEVSLYLAIETTKLSTYRNSYPDEKIYSWLQKGFGLYPEQTTYMIYFYHD